MVDDATVDALPAFNRDVVRLALALTDPSDLRAVLTALRGPDSGAEQPKLIYTAPIRRRVLSRQGYVDAGFWPAYGMLSGDLPDLAPEAGLRPDHYYEHVRHAVSVLRRTVYRAVEK